MHPLSIDRNVLLAWSPKFQETSIIACGTFSGEFKSSLNTNSRLELFNLSSNEPTQLASINTPSRFNRLLWTSVEANFKDLIIGSFDDGKLEVWDTQMILSADSSALIEIPVLHSGPVKGLARSCFQPNLIASGATNGEIALWDLNNLEKASLLSVKKSENFRNISDLAWNPRVPHIISASSDSGVISIIDLRSKNEVTSICIPKFSSISSIAWSPENPTYIVGASEDDSAPFIYSWDLRSNNNPESVFKGHSKGVLSLSWCQKDKEMCLSSGKDLKTLCWNPQSNEIYKELYSDEKIFDVQWCPTNPNFFCTSSFDKGINIHSINTISNENILKERDNIQIKSPYWFNRPIGATFGGNNVCAVFRSENQRISILKPEIDFINVIYNQLLDFEQKICCNKIKSLCDDQLKIENNEDYSNLWKLLKALSSPDIRSEILELVEIVNDKVSEISDTPELLLKHLNLNSDHININSLKIESKSLDKIIIDKIIKSDFEDAVMICIENKRFSDALIISTCGENSLRNLAEDLILEKSGSIYLNISKSIRQQDLTNFVEQTPLFEWKNILAVICNHSSPKCTESLLIKLAERLIQVNLNSCVIYVLMILGDFEKFLDIILRNHIRLSIEYENDDFYRNMVFAYKIIRILEVHRPNYISLFKNASTKALVYEIITKLEYLLFSSGFDANKAVTLTYYFDIYAARLQSKIFNVDSFVSHNNIKADFSQENYPQDCDHIHNNCIDKLSVSEFSIKSTIQNGLSNSNFHKTPFIPSWKSSSNIKYNDVPVGNPIFSKLSPILLSQASDLSVEIVALSLQKLSDRVKFNTTETNARIIIECFKKLSAEIICSKEYSNLSKPCIIALFNEIIAERFEQAGVLISGILATHFSETKDWILSLKRLIEYSKIK